MIGPSLLHELRVIVVSLVSLRYISRSRSASYLMCYPHMHSQIPRVDFTHIHTRGQLFGTLDRGHIIQQFLGITALFPVDFGEGVCNFLLQTTERVVLKNEISVAVRMDYEAK
jgi:hypothetical protein